MNDNPNVSNGTPPPYDIVGDVHGCIDELRELLNELGYVDNDKGGVRHPAGRTLVFVGDLADRGPANMAVWKLALASIESGAALLAPGNHDNKFARYLMGRNVQHTHGLEGTVREYRALPQREQKALSRAVLRLVVDGPPYLVLDNGNLVVAHAGLEAWMIGKVNKRISSFARYGEQTGELTATGLPVRRDWANAYRGKPLIVYGHTPVATPEFRNNTINIDQGCAFGGGLTALRYPERELVTVSARRVYAPPSMVERSAGLAPAAVEIG
ncbi:MAG: metallophosphoesterase [Chloroflexia bacterium]|nr:metallophosphoesterase [Chloroflexia bacterium]